MTSNIKSAYEDLFRKVVPYVMLMVVVAGLAAQSKIAGQQEQIVDLQNNQSKTELRIQGLGMASSHMNGDGVYNWLQQVTDHAMVPRDTIPAIDDRDFFVESFNRQTDENKTRFVEALNEKITTPNSDILVTLTYRQAILSRSEKT